MKFLMPSHKLSNHFYSLLLFNTFIYFLLFVWESGASVRPASYIHKRTLRPQLGGEFVSVQRSVENAIPAFPSTGGNR